MSGAETAWVGVTLGVGVALAAAGGVWAALGMLAAYLLLRAQAAIARHARGTLVIVTATDTCGHDYIHKTFRISGTTRR